MVYNFFILLMFLYLALTSATLNIPFDALIDQNLSKLVFSILDIELPSCSESVSKCFIVVIEVEVKFSKQKGYYGFIGERVVFVEILTEWEIKYIKLISLAMSIQCKVMWESNFRTPISFRSVSSSWRRLR